MRQLRDIVEHPIDCVALLPSRDLSEVWFELDGPEGTPFSEGRFVIVLQFGEQYPDVPPRGSFRTPIFHPNVAPATGEICVNTLKKDWQASMGLRHILVVVRCLLVEPNPESALHEEAGRLIIEDYNSYTRQALMMTRVHARRGAGVPRHHYPDATDTSGSETVGNAHLRLDEGKSSSSSMRLERNQGNFSSMSSACTPSDANLTNINRSSAGKRFMEKDSMMDFCFLASRENGDEEDEEVEKKKHYGKEDDAVALEYHPSSMTSSPHNSSSPIRIGLHHHPSSLSNLPPSLPIREGGLRAVDSNVPSLGAEKAKKKAAEKRKDALRRL